MNELSARDCCKLAALHRECLPDSLVSELGGGYTKSFYRYLSRSEREKVFVLRDGQEVMSACVLSLEPNTLTRRLVLRTSLLACAAARLLVHPLGMLRQIAGRKSEVTHEHLADSTPEVILIFTTPGSRSRGVGSALLQQCEAFLKAQGIPRYLVRTIDDDNNRALKFYLKNGFSEHGRSTEHGRVFRVFKKTL